MTRQIAYLAAASVLVLAAPTVAQEYALPRVAAGSYDGYYEYDPPVPPRPIPRYTGGQIETVVTTTRRIVTQPQYEPYENDVVVTKRQIVGRTPVYSEPVLVSAPLPPRRVSKDVVFAPISEHSVVPQRSDPRPPVIIEERRVETTRRIIRPAPEW